MKKYSLAIVDDHTLISHAIAKLVNSFSDFKTQFICKSGQ
jgi:hypothetical protein